MAASVYILSALVSVSSAVLLWRAYKRTRTSLLLWASACFLGLTLNNAMLLVDKVLVTRNAGEAP